MDHFLAADLIAVERYTAERWLQAHWNHSPDHPVAYTWPDDPLRRDLRCRCGLGLLLVMRIEPDRLFLRTHSYPHN